jgi:membrane protease YdiL (CAAX protease family)
LRSSHPGLGNDVAARRARLELAAVVGTGAVFLVFENVLDAKLPFIAAAALGWGAYLVARLRSTPGLAREWGFRTDTLAASLRLNGVLALVAAAALLAYGLARGRGLPPRTFLYLLALYPVWGLVQQFLLCALVSRNVERATNRPALAIVAGGVLFGLAHLPDWPLVALTTTGGFLWTAIFLRAPNLFVQGAAHGLLGALAYHALLGRDPWTELFGT